MINPKVVVRETIDTGLRSGLSLYKSVELWRFRGQYFKAYTTTDGYINLYFADKDGRCGASILTSWDYRDREAAAKWLNENVE